MKIPVAVVLSALLFATPALSQVPDEYTNLEILPEDIGKRELIGIMKEFTAALGARCTFCHEEKVPGDFSSIDWASDANEHKEVARGMMQLVQEINEKLLPAAIGDHDARVRCITCHRGVDEPETLDHLLVHTITAADAEAGERRYRELRDAYYGSGSYDFTPMTLATVAETLAREHDDVAGARRMIELNIEMNPDHADSYLMLAQLDLGAGETGAARANIEKALELEPGHRHAQRLLQQLGD